MPAIRVGGRRIPRSSRQRVLARARVPVVHSRAQTGIVPDYDHVDFEDCLMNMDNMVSIWAYRQGCGYPHWCARSESLITLDEVVSKTSPMSHTESYEQHVRRWKHIDANRRRNSKKGGNNKDMRRHHRVNQPGFDTQRRPVK